jgi:hypothetical protein
MNWEQWFCPEPSCLDEAWRIRRDIATRDLWWMAAHMDDSHFIVAAEVPAVCIVVRRC